MSTCSHEDRPRSYCAPRLPSLQDVQDAASSGAFSFRHCDVIYQEFAGAFEEYFVKISKRALSDLVAISDDAFETGLPATEADIAGPGGGASRSDRIFVRVRSAPNPTAASHPDHMLRIVSEPVLAAEDREIVLSGLREYNRQHASAPGFAPLHLLLREDDGRIHGGLLGETGWQWLHIQILWVEESLRGQGLGSRLLTSAETGGRERGCTAVYLDTFDFQALPFYRRHGYEVFGVLEDYPPGSRRHFLRKSLMRDGEESSA